MNNEMINIKYQKKFKKEKLKYKVNDNQFLLDGLQFS